MHRPAFPCDHVRFQGGSGCSSPTTLPSNPDRRTLFGTSKTLRGRDFLDGSASDGVIWFVIGRCGLGFVQLALWETHDGKLLIINEKILIFYF